MSEEANTNGTESLERQVALEKQLFELAQRKAKIYSESSLVPKEYQGNIGNVLIAENMAKRMGADPLMVMQNLYVVHGKPGWSATFLIASFNSNGKFSAIKYRFKGEPNTPEWGCQAYCTELATNEVIEGTWITWAMAQKEGWVNKSGSKWQSMPEQMFRYRAATFLIRATAPEIGMGLLTKDELEDSSTNPDEPTEARAGIGGIKQRLGIEEPATVDGEIVEPKDATPKKTKKDAEPISTAQQCTAVVRDLEKSGAVSPGELGDQFLAPEEHKFSELSEERAAAILPMLLKIKTAS